MTTVRDEIRAVVKESKLSPQEFRELTHKEAETVYLAALRKFVPTGTPIWWWEHFTKYSSLHFLDDDGSKFIARLVSTPNTRVWFIVGEDDDSNYPVFGATVTAVQSVVENCFAFEYYIISKELDWLLCENHHGVMFAVGEPLETKLEELASELGLSLVRTKSGA